MTTAKFGSVRLAVVRSALNRRMVPWPLAPSDLRRWGDRRSGAVWVR